MVPVSSEVTPPQPATPTITQRIGTESTMIVSNKVQMPLKIVPYAGTTRGNAGRTETRSPTCSSPDAEAALNEDPDADGDALADDAEAADNSCEDEDEAEEDEDDVDEAEEEDDDGDIGLEAPFERDSRLMAARRVRGKGGESAFGENADPNESRNARSNPFKRSSEGTELPAKRTKQNFSSLWEEISNLQLLSSTFHG
jgi:hypothetical protein